MKKHSKNQKAADLPGLQAAPVRHSARTLDAIADAADLAALTGCTGLAVMLRHTPQNGTVHNVPAVLRHYSTNIIKMAGTGAHPTTPLEWAAAAAAVESAMGRGAA